MSANGTSDVRANLLGTSLPLEMMLYDRQPRFDR